MNSFTLRVIAICMIKVKLVPGVNALLEVNEVL